MVFDVLKVTPEEYAVRIWGILCVAEPSAPIGPDMLACVLIEALLIQLNRDAGMSLSGAWKPLISHLEYVV